jgi:kumamolisin
MVRTGPADPSINIFVTVHLRRKPRPEAHISRGRAWTRGEVTDQLGAEPKDFPAIRLFAKKYGLTVQNESTSKRSLELHGELGDISKAFGVTVSKVSSGGRTFLQPDTLLTIPAELEGIIHSVNGFDTRPQARSHHKWRPAGSVMSTTPGSAQTFTPSQVAALYSFPTALNGFGETIAILELGGGYAESDLNTFFQNLGLTAPSVTSVSVDGVTNTPGGEAAVEVTMDIEIAGAVAPGADIKVYFAPNSDQGFIDAMNEAVNGGDPPSVVSISWGGPEATWSQQSLDAFNRILEDASHLGIPVCISTGDIGSTDGTGALAVEFPSSSQYALACGGTSVKVAGSKITSEVVWNDGDGATGGGVSTVFSKPSYQSETAVPSPPSTTGGRGVPDVSADADPATGYQLFINGQSSVAGGTSAVAPLWAGLVARFAQSLGGPVGFLNPILYLQGAAGCFNDITQGDNYTSGGPSQYSAGPGWDACTGLGSPNGNALLALLESLK